MNAISILSVFSFCYVLVEIKIPIIIKFCDFFELYDESDDYRKHHVPGISRLGGLGVFSTFISVLMFIADVTSPDILALVLSGTFIFIAGLKDDVGGGLNPAEKFCAQIVASVILSCCGGYRLLVPVTGIDELDRQLSLILSLFAIVTVINAFNLIDGLDGLAGTVSLLVHIMFGILFFHIGNMKWGLISFALSGAVAGFLRFNYIPGTVFMGDSGAMLIGLVSVASAMKLLSVCSTQAVVGMTWSSSVLGLCISILIVPVFDTFRIFIVRIFQKRSPFKGDRNHIHHRLKALKISDRKVVSILICFNIWVVVLSVCLSGYGNVVVITMSFVSCIIGNTLLSYLKGRRI